MFNPNVALTDLGVKLLMADKGDVPDSIEIIGKKEWTDQN